MSCIQLLEIHRSGVDLLSANRWGLTGLHHAAALGHKRIVKYLIEQGCRSELPGASLFLHVDDVILVDVFVYM